MVKVRVWTGILLNGLVGRVYLWPGTINRHIGATAVQHHRATWRRGHVQCNITRLLYAARTCNSY